MTTPVSACEPSVTQLEERGLALWCDLEGRRLMRETQAVALVESAPFAAAEIMAAPDALKAEPTTGGVTRLLAEIQSYRASPMDRLPTLLEPESFGDWLAEGAHFPRDAVGEGATTLYAAAFRTMGIGAHIAAPKAPEEYSAEGRPQVHE
jgi:hypothetical protein